MGPAFQDDPLSRSVGTSRGGAWSPRAGNCRKVTATWSPHARETPYWQGPDNPPAAIASNTGGVFKGKAKREQKAFI